VQFGPLFPVWVAVLGLSVFWSLDSAVRDGRDAVRGAGDACGRVVPHRRRGVVRPAVVERDRAEPPGRGLSRGATTWDVPTNPVHVLDLALFLPAVVTSGVLLLRRHPFGYATVVGNLVLLALTCLPILLTSFVAVSRGHEPGWAVLVPVPIGAVLGVLGATLRPRPSLIPNRRYLVKKIILTVALVLGTLALTGCSDQLGDRGGVDGAAPDRIGDVDYSEVHRNVDGFPNIARTCVPGLGFATPSTGNGDFGGATPLIRVTERDAFCATKSPTG